MSPTINGFGLTLPPINVHILQPNRYSVEMFVVQPKQIVQVSPSVTRVNVLLRVSGSSAPVQLQLTPPPRYNIELTSINQSVEITRPFTKVFAGVGMAQYALSALSASYAHTASAATSITFTPVTASYALTASYAENVPALEWDNVSNKPDNLVSSSLQINTGSFSGSFTGDGSGLTGVISSSYSVSSSLADVANLVYLLQTGSQGVPFTTQDYVNILGSSGVVSGGDIIVLDSASFYINSGSGLFRTTTDPISSLGLFVWATSSIYTLETGSRLFCGVDYNASNPIPFTQISNSWDYITNIPLGSVVRGLDGLNLYPASNPHKIEDSVGRSIRRWFETSPFARDEVIGGLILASSLDNNRYISVSAGAWWSRLNRSVFSGIDTSGSDTFTVYYRGSSPGEWVTDQDVSVWPNTQYDDGSGTLQDMTNNRYGVLWFYLGPGGTVSMLHGTSNATSQQNAASELAPESVPPRLEYRAILLGRIIFKKSDNIPTETDSVFSSNFTISPVTVHSQLAGLTADDHPQYPNIQTQETITGTWSFETAPDITGSLDVSGSVDIVGGLHVTGSLTDEVRMGLGPSGSLLFISSSGNIGMDIENPLYKLHVGGDIYAEGDVTAYSDKRLKTDITPISNALEIVQKLEGVYFTRVDDVTKRRNLGVIAQEVREILPEAVVGSEEDGYGVNYGNMVGVLIEAIKELKSELDQLKSNSS